MLAGAGGIQGEYHGVPVVRHFGDPAAEYRAAAERMAVFDRSHRTRLVVSGRAPGKMLNGVVTGSMPDSPVERGGVQSGRATYHAVLTPKGKMISDLWMTRLGDEAAMGYLLDVPVAGAKGLLALFARVLPPRFAAVRDVSGEVATLSLVGPAAAETLSDLALDGLVSPEELRALEEGEWRCVGSPADGLLVQRVGDVEPEAWSVTGPVDPVARLWQRLVDAGARPAGLGVWSTLRVEAGRPAFGSDMDEETIPIEAGIEGRAIDHAKGCYTGQEVIVRIRDRGHVNRHLRLLALGDVPTPAAGQDLLAADHSGKVAGRITSSVQSPARGETIALAYVARGNDRVLFDGREIPVPSQI